MTPDEWTIEAAKRRDAQRPQASEHDEQSELFKWAALMAGRVPELALLYAIPNGGARHPATAAKLKAEGVKAGVPDICLPVARRAWHSLYIELKVGRNKPTALQLEWMALLQSAGHCVDVSYSWHEAACKIISYLGHDAKDFGL